MLFFSFHSSCGLFVDRGMGNHMLARQVVIRSFTSSRGKMGCLSCAIPRMSALPNARRHQREAKAKRLLGDRGPWTSATYDLELMSHTAVHVSLRRSRHVGRRQPRDRRLKGSSVNVVAECPHLHLGVKSHWHSSPVTAVCWIHAQWSTWCKDSCEVLPPVVRASP